MANRIWNFNPGPATLPLPVLEKMKEDLPVYNDTGMAVMELSHRSKDYAEIHAQAKSLLKELFSVPENHHILFLQGGASSQFYMIPMNLLSEGQTADYVNTGAWSKKAIKEAKFFGNVHIAGTSEEDNFTYIPKELNFTSDARYVHITSNNTIAGTQWYTFPETRHIPLMADMSSDILCKKIDVSKFGLIYAGAQKNLGPSGVTVVILRDDVLNMCKESNPTMVKYATHVEKDSLFNTAPTYSIYILKLVLEYVKNIGGLVAVEKENNEKADLLYGTINAKKDFFRCPVKEDSRSIMNIVFRLPSEELEAKFIADGLSSGFGGLKGHRSVGGIRVSMYNAMPLKGIQELADFMKDFADNNG
jgi:phosphoserine aminotransferase